MNYFDIPNGDKSSNMATVVKITIITSSTRHSLTQNLIVYHFKIFQFSTHFQLLIYEGVTLRGREQSVGSLVRNHLRAFH